MCVYNEKDNLIVTDSKQKIPTIESRNSNIIGDNLIEVSKFYVVHAEMSAVSQIIKNGWINNKIDLFITKSPCILCWLILKNLNVNSIYYVHTYEKDFRIYDDSYNKNINIYKIISEKTTNTVLQKNSEIEKAITRNTEIDIIIKNGNSSETIKTKDFISEMITVIKNNENLVKKKDKRNFYAIPKTTIHVKLSDLSYIEKFYCLQFGKNTVEFIE